MLKKLMASAFAVAALTTTALADPVYMIAQIQIEDQEKYFSEYGTAVFPIVMGTGAKVLVATPSVETLEGDWVGNWTVVIEFPSEDAALKECYNSEAYVEVRKLRMATTSVGNLVVAPAFVPPSQ
jgi:uncharacterized protein (DUF1330 family)